MKYRNNKDFNVRLFGKQKFGLRKLSIGLAAVTLGTTFFLTNGQLVHADTENKSVATESNTDVQSSTPDQNKQVQTSIPEQTKNTQKSVTDDKEAVNTTADLMNSDGSKTPVNGRNVMAENDNVQVNVHYQNDHLTAGQKIKVSYENSSDWTVVGWENGETKKLGDSFSAINNGDGSFTISSNIKGEASSNFDINFALQYAKNVDAPTPETLTVKTAHDDANNQSIISSSKFTPTIIPYEDKVQSDEIAHGWASKATKSVNNNDDNSRDILNGTSATQKGQDRKLMQYMIEWNYGKAGNTDGTILSPLQKANFTARFSEGQTLLPDTIKVFRVYQPDAVKANGNRVDINSVYNDITKYDQTTGQFMYEDQAFEQFLKDHLTVTTTSNGTTKNLSWKDYQKALSKAKKDHTEPPMVNGLHLDENDMYHVKLSTDPENQSHNFAVNPDNNTNKSVSTPHSTFFIQMDTLLDQNMPIDWTKPGNGPSITYNSVSGDFNGIGSNIKKSTSPIFEGGGNGFSHDNSYSATLHFADVNDSNKIISLDTGHDVTVLHGQKEAHATEQTPITFANAEDAIKTLENQGYIFVGASRGTKTSGEYTGSDLYESSTYKDDKYGEYGDEHAIQVSPYSWTQSFTLNFVHKITDTQQTKSVIENIKYIDEATGKEIHNQFNSSEIIFTRTQHHDEVTKTDSYTPWDLKNLNSVSNPVIPDYTIDPDKITEKLNDEDFKLAQTDANEIGDIKFTEEIVNGLPDKSIINFVVPYIKKSQPTEPEKPSTPSSNPSKPTEPVKPSTPSSNPSKPTEPVKPSTPSSNPSKPTNPVKPSTPSSNPSKPTEPVNPSTPSSVPSEPSQPTNASTPAPVLPETPENPTQPSQTSQPQQSEPENNESVRPLSQREKQPSENSHNTTTTVRPHAQNVVKQNAKKHSTNEVAKVIKPKSEKVANPTASTSTNQKALPQTGESQNKLGLIGLVIAAFASLLGLADRKKRKN